MTRDELMKRADMEIRSMLGSSVRNRIMNIVEQAWAEGKRNSESEEIAKTMKYAITKMFHSEDGIKIETVVRCKDCDYYGTACSPEGCGYCQKYEHGCSDDFYCADGIRQKGAEEPWTN